MGAVLIVDDSAADRALLRTILGRAGYTVYEVAKGREAVQKAREVRPHIIILDVNLPDMNGLAVCRAIRADREIASVPVLMLTVRRRRHRRARRARSRGRRLRRQGLGRRDRARAGAPLDSVSPDVQHGDAQSAARPGRPSSGRNRARDSWAARGDPRQRRAALVYRVARQRKSSMDRCDSPQFAVASAPARSSDGDGAQQLVASRRISSCRRFSASRSSCS